MMSPAVLNQPITTTELMRQVSALVGRPISRHQLYRTRMQYGDRAPGPFRAGMNFVWDRSAPGAFADILKAEERCKIFA
jgi:hypothetical protein